MILINTRSSHPAFISVELLYVVVNIIIVTKVNEITGVFVVQLPLMVKRLAQFTACTYLVIFYSYENG